MPATRASTKAAKASAKAAKKKQQDAKDAAQKKRSAVRKHNLAINEIYYGRGGIEGRDQMSKARLQAIKKHAERKMPIGKEARGLAKAVLKKNADAVELAKKKKVAKALQQAFRSATAKKAVAVRRKSVADARETAKRLEIARRKGVTNRNMREDGVRVTKSRIPKKYDRKTDQDMLRTLKTMSKSNVVKSDAGLQKQVKDMGREVQGRLNKTRSLSAYKKKLGSGFGPSGVRYAADKGFYRADEEETKEDEGEENHRKLVARAPWKKGGMALEVQRAAVDQARDKTAAAKAALARLTQPHHQRDPHSNEDALDRYASPAHSSPASIMTPTPFMTDHTTPRKTPPKRSTVKKEDPVRKRLFDVVRPMMPAKPRRVKQVAKKWAERARIDQQGRRKAAATTKKVVDKPPCPKHRPVVVRANPPGKRVRSVHCRKKPGPKVH